MSQQPIARSADLTRLRNDGYTIRIVGGYLMVEDVPFVDTKRAVQPNGALVMALTLAGDVTTKPSDHTARFIGGVPCHVDGQTLAHIINHTRPENIGNGLTTSCYLSAKPRGNGKYNDYHHKVTSYVGHITGQAHVSNPESTARRYRPTIADTDDLGPFNYIDTASSRAGTTALNALLAEERVAIVGLGGTGEYILDAASKSHAVAVHIFDADEFLTHNAFRAPGAPSIKQLAKRPLKVDYFGDIYDQIHNGIHRHHYRVDESNVNELSDMTFVFIAIDDAEAKAAIIEFLVANAIPFIDVGMGVDVVQGCLTGSVRTTLVTPELYDHASTRIPTVSVDHDDDQYRSNIQIVELNMLNAAHAVIHWKKYRGFYADWDGPHHMVYSIASNRIANDEYVAPSEDEDENEKGEAA